MHPKCKNKSTQKVLQERNNNSRYPYDRKCHTPSIGTNNKKKSKTKDKVSDKNLQKKHNFNSIRNMKPSDLSYQIPTHKKQSPFKHRNRPISNLANARHAKNIDQQLSNLNDSIFNHGSVLNQSNKKLRYSSTVVKEINEGKRLMKQNQFRKAMELFNDSLHRDQTNIDIKYLMGVCAFHLESYEEVIKHLSIVIVREETYRKNVYLFLAIAYKKVVMIDEALLTLTKALHLYPKYYDALILRAKLLSKQKRFYDAIDDLSRCIKLEPKTLQAYISKADCLRLLGQFKQAIKIYIQILSVKSDPDILLKKAITYIQNNDIDEALVDLNKIIAKNPRNSEAFLFKGSAFSKAKDFNEAILSYEQAIKFNSSKKATTKALYEIAKLKIETGDFYGASYTLQRAESLEVDLKIVERLRLFTEGATLIMKRKYHKGIENMNTLSRKQHINQQIKPLIFAFRSYAHFCQYKFLSAMADLKLMQKSGLKLDPASEYNFQLLDGIICCQNNKFNEAIHNFSLAEVSRKTFGEPLAYKCLTKVCEFNRNPKNKNLQLMSQAIECIGEAIEKEENFNYYYICACILYTMGEIPEALQNIEKSMKLSEENVIKHFYLRGLIHAIMEKYKQAYNDFNAVLTLMKDNKEKEKDQSDSDDVDKEKDILETYLNRAKCYLIFGDKKKAFHDLKTYISMKPLDSEIHAVAGKLLFSIGACQDAIKAYNYSANIQKNKDQLLERMKCNVQLKQLNQCIKDMERLIELGDQISKIDYCCLFALKQASKGKPENFKQAIKKIELVDEANKNGRIFMTADQFFYKGVFYFHLENYELALKFFTKSKNIKVLDNELDIMDDKNGEGFSDEDFENRVYCDSEIDYNIGLCHLMLGNKEAAQKTLLLYESCEVFFKSEETEMNEPIDLTPFPISNRLCSIFPEIHYGKYRRFKLSFCLPTVYPPQIKFQIENNIIEGLNMSSAEPKPDAPWIRRNNFGVVFTDSVIGLDIDIQTEKSLKKLQEIRIDQEDSPRSPPKDLNRWKQMLALDQETQSRLARIAHK